MKYLHEELGFYFELPDGWRQEKNNNPLTFFGPNGRLGKKSEVIQVKLGPVLPEFIEIGRRQEFFIEPGAKISQTSIGLETNAVYIEKPTNCELSIVSNGVHYSILFASDNATKVSMECLKQSARFPNASQAAVAIKNWADPKRQAMAKLLHVDTAEEARKIFTAAGIPPAIARPGYTMHKSESGKRLIVEDLGNTEFEISRMPAPVLQGAKLTGSLKRVRGKKIFLQFDHTIDGPQTAARLITETLTTHGAFFDSTLSGANIAIWIGGTGHGLFAFVVLDTNDHSRYRCYNCGAMELTTAIMTSVIYLEKSRSWWKFW